MTAPRRGRAAPSRRLAGRAVWAIADQGLSSLTNFALGVVVARELPPASFGAFGIAFATYAFILNISNGVISEPFQMRFSDVPLASWRKATNRATGTAVSVGLAAAVVCGTTALVARGALEEALLALSLTLPALTLQDSWRAVFFARHKGEWSFVNDLVWAVTLVPALAIASRAARNTLFWLVLAWGSAAGVAAVAGAIQARCIPKLMQTSSWVRQQRDLVPRLVAEMLVYSGGYQVAFIAIGAAGGLTVVAGIRGAEILLGPLYVVTFGIRVMAVPEAVALLGRSAAKMRRALVMLATGFSALAVVFGIGTLAIPGRWGTALLGSTWTAARPALLPMAVFMAASGVSISARIGLRALGDARRTLKARLQTMPLVVAGGTVGAAIGGSREAAWGLAVGMVVDVIRSWRELGSALLEREHSSSQPSAADLDDGSERMD